jgi:CTP:phosphocholine cytidylyltransferase-like protein
LFLLIIDNDIFYNSNIYPKHLVMNAYFYVSRNHDWKSKYKFGHTMTPIVSTDKARQKACDMYIESIKERSTDDEIQPLIFDKAYWEIRNIKIFGNINSRYDSVNSPFNG